MEFNYIYIVIAIIIALVLFYFGYTYLIKNRGLKGENLSSIDITALLDALGGKDNISHVKSSPSKLTVSIKDRNLVNIENIRQLGASGIVEGKENLSMIFGKESALIDQDLKRIL